MIFDISKQVEGEAQTKLIQFVDTFRRIPNTAQKESDVEWCKLRRIGWAARDSDDSEQPLSDPNKFQADVVQELGSTKKDSTKRHSGPKSYVFTPSLRD